MFHALKNNRGFTLTELLVAMGLSAVVMASIGYVYYSQQKSYLVQENLAAAQQNLRTAMYFIERDIRMAGCDPTQNITPAPGIQDIGWDAGENRYTSLSFTSDSDGDRAVENISYSWADNDGDGNEDCITRNGDLIAENIDALDFVYLNSSGNPATTISQIRTVQVSVVAKTGRADQGYTDTRIYENQQGTTILAAQNDRFRRKQLDATIKLRN
jgi:type IV pilus assembly protein PilW